MSKWIEFVLIGASPTGKTVIWRVASKEGNIDLGEIKFFPRWRKYCFFPFVNTIFEEDCLRDIADFCVERTHLWRIK